jgi:hypothetical protein
MSQTETYKATPEIPDENLQNGVRVIQAFCRDSYMDTQLYAISKEQIAEVLL